MRNKTVLAATLLAVLLIGAPRGVAAQQFGLLGGATFTDIGGSDAADDFDRSNGFLAGLFARIPLGEIITFQPEVQFARKGAEAESVTNDAAVKLDYIDVPLFLSFGFPGSFHAMVGPNFSFEIGCDQDIDPVTGGEINRDCDQDSTFDDRKSFVAGATVGVGIDLPLGGFGFFIDGRFNVDLESFNENEGIDWKNQAFELVGGVLLGR